jgi:hypothetical protein
MAKITISQLHTVDTASIQELTNAEIDTTKGGLLPALPVDVFAVAFGASDFTLDTVNGTVSSAQKYLAVDFAKSLGLA